MISDSVRITILIDNHAANGLTAEHGLSLWIEADNKHILFDTGQGSAVEDNAQILGIDLEKTDILVLSHGHYDHTGGVPFCLKRARNVDVYCHPGVVNPRYSVSKGISKPIHMPQLSIEEMGKLPSGNLHWIQQPVLLNDRIGITGPIPRKTSYEDTGGPFYLDPEGKRADPIEDDLALWIRTDEGAIVCVGCSHAGVVNTLLHIQHLTHGQRLRAIIG